MAGFHEVLAEAERMKEECVQLREQVNQLKDVEVLIRGSEASANELMEKYRDQQGNYAPTVINDLFKWLSVLRNELAEGKLRIAKYRKDVYRLRRAHASASNRVSCLERKLENSASRISQLEAEMAQMCDLRQGGLPVSGGILPTPTVNCSPVNPMLATPSAAVNQSSTSSVNETRLDLDRCLGFIDISTPDMSSKSLKMSTPSTNVRGFMLSFIHLFIGKHSCLKLSSSMDQWELY